MRDEKIAKLFASPKVGTHESYMTEKLLTGNRIFCYIRGSGFKFVDFLYKSSDVGYKEIKIKIISPENTFFYSLPILCDIKNSSTRYGGPPSPGARSGNFDVETTSNFNKINVNVLFGTKQHAIR